MLGFVSVFVLGYRVDKSIIPSPFDQLDDLYCGFYASIVVHCLKEQIVCNGLLIHD